MQRATKNDFGWLLIEPLEYVKMNTLTLFKVGSLTTILLSSGSLWAGDLNSPSTKERLQFQQQTRVDGKQDQPTFRQQVQTRMQTMSQEEHKLMQDTGFNGRARMAEETSRNSMKREQAQAGNNGNGYGRGFESRQMQQAAPAMGISSFGATGSSPSPGMGAQGSSHSRGR